MGVKTENHPDGIPNRLGSSHISRIQVGVKGLKGAKAAQLIAAMEIARRVSVPAKRGQLIMKSTTTAAEYLRERLRGLMEEQFHVLFLNRRNALLEDVLIAQGSVDIVRPILRIITDCECFVK